ncbi:Tn3 family transposase [Nonomuraea sp. NPDC049480]|uniref:Tn3 family transposase n=1 Tax=Nonomuraea sp. NPDC049480 TaxID=3364353 RepID=UPI00379439F1
MFSYLASELKSGDIAVAGSDSYANLHDQLMSWEECEPLVAEFCAEAGLPTNPRELTRHYRQLLADTAAEVDSGYPANPDLTLEGGRPMLKRRKGAERSKEALKLEEAVHERLPQRDKTVAADGSQIETWENNLLAESHIRYGGYGGLAYRHISNTYVALFSRFIPCGVWEAVHIIEGLLKNASEIQPDTIHADTQGQSLPVFGLAALMGFDLLPRIRNWHDLIFYRPTPGTPYQHIDSLFGDEAIDWTLIETHWTDLLHTAISIRENRLSSVTLLRRLGNHSRKNRLYRAFRELGRAVRTITLLRYLSDADLREQITQVTNRNESFHNFADGHPVDLDDLATISPYITQVIRRFGNWILNLTPPAADPTTRLDLESQVLFAP